MDIRTDAGPAGCHDVLRLTPVEVTHRVVRTVSRTEITAARTLYKHQQTSNQSSTHISTFSATSHFFTSAPNHSVRRRLVHC